MAERYYTWVDQLLMQFDRGIKTLSAQHLGERPNPADNRQASVLSKRQQRVSAGLMRVNHSGEVSAQALYQGQALAARDEQVKRKMQHSAEEENDHLDWCRQRIDELDSHTSYLNWAWYLGSLTIGFIAGLAGDQWSLGFVAETERQVVSHLDDHLHRLPAQDVKSRAIVETMKDDEGHHATVATEYGARSLPVPVRFAMSWCSRVMTGLAYWI